MNNFLIPKGFIFRFVDSPELYGNSETEWLYQLTILQKNLNSTSFLNSINSWLSFSINTNEGGGNPELSLIETSTTEKDKIILSIKIDIKDEELFDKNAYLQIKLYNDVKVSYIIQILEKLKLNNFNLEVIFPDTIKELLTDRLRCQYFINILKCIKCTFYSIVELPLGFKELSNVNNLTHSFSLNSGNGISHNYILSYCDSSFPDLDIEGVKFKIAQGSKIFPYDDLKKLIYSTVMHL